VREGEIVALTSLRGIAAMAVVMQHFLGDGSVALPGDDTIVDAARLSGC
jgi:peptidoglycan/LPS O-acetylase OafA/YrhL